MYSTSHTIALELGKRDKLKVMIGGAPTTFEFSKYVGADFKKVDPIESVKKCLEWVEK
jgi:methanogenic corrinoid protein MtbC1